MAISGAFGGGSELSDAALRLYGACAIRNAEQVEEILSQHPGARDELFAWGLITLEEQPGGVPGIRDPQHALQCRTDEVLAAAEAQVALLKNLPSLAADLNRHYDRVQQRAHAGASVYLDDQAAVNARLQDVVGGARREILAAQPGGPRDQILLDKAMARDSVALDRGVEMRTLYRDTVRDHAGTARYARTMATRGAGRSAQYRTLAGTFERMILVDGEIAVVEDHIVAGSPPHAAWVITDPACVAVLARVFHTQWMWARPWTGELRARRGDARDTVGSSAVAGARTTRRQRQIMRYLCNGVSQAQIARRIGVSERKLTGEISVLKGLWGVGTMNELIFHWAQSPDQLVDDSAPTALRATGADREAGTAA